MQRLEVYMVLSPTLEIIQVSTNREWISALWYVHIKEYHPARKEKDISLVTYTQHEQFKKYVLWAGQTFKGIYDMIQFI
jgi:hypothetical protein